MRGRPQRRSRELYPVTLVCGHCGVEYNGNRLAKAQRGQRGYSHATPKQRADPDTYQRYQVARCIGWFVAADEIEEKIENLVIRERASVDFDDEMRTMIMEGDTFRASAEEVVVAKKQLVANSRAKDETLVRISDNVGGPDDGHRRRVAFVAECRGDVAQEPTPLGAFDGGPLGEHPPIFNGHAHRGLE